MMSALATRVETEPRGTALQDTKPVTSATDNPKLRNKLVRRYDRDYSQLLRLGVQAIFFTLNIWIGFQFYL
jgi:hypothetical protein